MSNKANLIWDSLTFIGFVILYVLHFSGDMRTWEIIVSVVLFTTWIIRLIYRYWKYKHD